MNPVRWVGVPVVDGRGCMGYGAAISGCGCGCSIGWLAVR